MEDRAAMQHHRNRRRSLLAIRLEAECLQQLVEFTQIADRHVRLQIGEWIAVIDAQNSAPLGRRLWRQKNRVLDIYSLALAVVVGKRLSGHRNIVERSPTRHAGRSELEIAVHLNRIGSTR